jgi:hypothetical protein
MTTLCRISMVTWLYRGVSDLRRARIRMGVLILSLAPRKRWAACLAVAASTVGCATPSLTKTAVAPIATEVSPQTRREVQAIRTEPTSVDGQTCWIIEPDVPRIPKIGGVEPQLPPHIERRLSYAFDLAQRGATYSANAEFRAVLSLCALELDARSGGTSRREALRQGLVALDEADQLAGHHLDWRELADVRLASAGHETPVLKDHAAEVDAIQAVQLYYAFAEERFTCACEGMPSASLAYYGLARTYVLPGTHFTHAAGKAAMLQRVALRIEPRNVLAGNELGVLLTQHGHLDQAELLFRQCVATDASPETWQNLAVVYARQGDADASQAAMAAGAALAASEHPLESAIAQTGPPSADGKPNDDTAQSPDSDQKPGFWENLNVASKLPNVFRR